MADQEIGSVTAKFVADVQGFLADIERIIGGLKQTGQQAIATGQQVQQGSQQAEDAIHGVDEALEEQIDLFGVSKTQMTLFAAETGKATKSAELSFTSFGQGSAKSIDVLNEKIRGLTNVSGDVADRVTDEMGKVELAFRNLGGHSDLEFQKMRVSAQESFDAISQSALTTADDQARAANLFQAALNQIDAKAKESVVVQSDLEAAFKTLGVESSASIEEARDRITQAYELIMQSTVATIEEQNRATDEYKESMKQLDEAAGGATSSQEDLANGLDKLNSVLTAAGIHTAGLTSLWKALTSTWGLVLSVAGALGTVLWKGVAALQANAEEVKTLMAVTGLEAEAADNLAGTFKILGASTASLSTAMFRLTAELETGGEGLQKLGISLRDASGQLKNEGTLFLEIRNRISEMGTTSERSAALMDLFGRAGRSLASIFALNREEFEKWQAVAGGISKWTQEAQGATEEYNRKLAMLGLQFDAMWQTVGLKLLPVLTQFIENLNRVAGGSPYVAEVQLKMPEQLPEAVLVTLGRKAGQLIGESMARDIEDALRGTLFEGIANRAAEAVRKATGVTAAGQEAARAAQAKAAEDANNAEMARAEQASNLRKKLDKDKLIEFEGNLNRELQAARDNASKQQALAQQSAALRTATEENATRSQMGAIQALATAQKKFDKEMYDEQKLQGLSAEKLANMKADAASKQMGFSVQLLNLTTQLSLAEEKTLELTKEMNAASLPDFAKLAIIQDIPFENVSVQLQAMEHVFELLRGQIDPTHESLRIIRDRIRELKDELAAGAKFELFNELILAIRKAEEAAKMEGMTEAARTLYTATKPLTDVFNALVVAIFNMKGVSNETRAALMAQAEAMYAHGKATVEDTDATKNFNNELKRQFDELIRLGSEMPGAIKGLTDYQKTIVSATKQEVASQIALEHLRATTGLTGAALADMQLRLKLFPDAIDPATGKLRELDATEQALFDNIKRNLATLASGSATQAFTQSLDEIAEKARILGPDFDAAGARVAAAQAQFNAMAADLTLRGTPALEQAGKTLRDALASQKLEQDVQRMFLSITDTFTKMADALIAGTLDIDKAFADLGKSLLTNFVQVVLHGVFDPILKEAASFVSSLIGMLTGLGGGAGGGGWGSALATMVGGAVRGYLGMGPQAYGTGTMLGPPSPGGSGGSDLLGIGGSVVSGLGTAYQIIGVEMLKLPSLFSYVGQGLTYLGEAVGILTPSATAAATELAAVATAGEAAWLAGGTAAESAALVTEAAAAVTEGAAVAATGASSLASTIASLAAAVAPFAMVAGAIAAVVMGMKALSGHFDYLSKRRREQETRQGMAMKTDLVKDLEGMTLQNLMEGERRRHMEFIMAVAEYRGPHMEELENRRKAGQLRPEDIPPETPGYDASIGAMPSPEVQAGFKFEMSPALEAMKSLINNLTNLGMKSSWLWGQQGGGKGPGSGSGAMNELLSDGEWWDALITAYDNAIKKLLGQTEPLTKSLRVVASEATIAAASLNTIAQILGVATMDVPDFKKMVEDWENGLRAISLDATKPPQAPGENVANADDSVVRKQIDDAIKNMKDQLVNSLMAEPVKITGLLDLGSLQQEGEDIKDTIKRVAEALQGLGDMMTRLNSESAMLTNTMDVQAQMNVAMQGLYRAQVEAQQTLMSTQDPTVMLAAAQQVEALIKERYRLETELATSLMEKYRALAGVVINSISAIANAGDMLTQMGISILGITQASAGFVMGLDDAQLQLQAFPALVAAAFAEAGQVVAATGSARAGLDVVLGAPVEALRDTFSEVMEILDPSARASALQAFLGQINSFFQEAVSGIKTYYAAARQEAERLADVAIKGIRDAAAAQIAPLQAVKEQAQAGLELLAEQREAIQENIAGIREGLALQVEALNEQKEGLQDQIDAIREALKVRVDALNDEKDMIHDMLDDYVKPLQKERDEIQKTLKIRLKALNDEKEAIQDALKVRVDALEDERDLIQKTLKTQMDALTDEKDALEKILDVAQRASQIAKGLREALKDLAIGDLAPPDAQAQFAAARQAFQSAAPEEAGAAGKALLDTALKTGLMTRPDPEFRALWAEVTARLQSMALGQEALASPEQATLMRLEAIEALSKSLNDTAESRLTVIADELDTLRGVAEAQLEAIAIQVESLQDAATERLDVIDDLLSTANEIANTRLEAIDDEIKSLNKQAEAYLKPLEEGVKTIDDSIKTLNKEAKEALKPLEASLKLIDIQTKDLNDSIKTVDKSIAGINKQADADVKAVEEQREAYLKQLSLDEQTAIGMVKDTLAPIAWATVQAIGGTTSVVQAEASDTKQIMNAVMGSLAYDAFIADRTKVMADSLSVLSTQIYQSLDNLIRGRLDTLIGIGQGGGDTAIKDALTQAGLGKVVSNTYDAAFNLAQLVWGTFRQSAPVAWPQYPTAEKGMDYVPRTGPVLLHRGERVLTAQENQDYGRGGEGGGVQVTMNIYGVDDPKKLVDELEDELIRRARMKTRLYQAFNPR